MQIRALIDHLPSHTVIIKDTRVLSSERPQWESLSHLDVLQMFARTRRPQSDESGEGVILIGFREPLYSVSVLIQQLLIESNLLRSVALHINTEVSPGTVASVADAAARLVHTDLAVRMGRTPKLYWLGDRHKAER